MYVCMYVCMYVRTYVCMYVCMCGMYSHTFFLSLSVREKETLCVFLSLFLSLRKRERETESWQSLISEHDINVVDWAHVYVCV